MSQMRVIEDSLTVAKREIMDNSRSMAAVQSLERNQLANALIASNHSLVFRITRSVSQHPTRVCCSPGGVNVPWIYKTHFLDTCQKLNFACFLSPVQHRIKLNLTRTCFPRIKALLRHTPVTPVFYFYFADPLLV